MKGSPPIDPGGPIPDCSNDSPTFKAVRERRWLSLEVTSGEGEVARYVVEITPDGPESFTRVTDVDQDSSFDGWSADGRYFALSHGAARLPEIFDMAGGAPPVSREVSEPSGNVRCQSADRDGTCVRSLPPRPDLPPILVGLEGEATFSWPGTGAHLLVERRFDPRLIHVELYGGDFVRHFIAPIFHRPGSTPRPTTRWNPNGHDDWFVYVAPRPDHRTPRPRLWYRETQESFLVGPRSGGVPEEISWSPDGRYFARNDALRSEGTTGGILYQELEVLEVLDGELGREWTIGSASGNAAGGTRDFHWQP